MVESTIELAIKALRTMHERSAKYRELSYQAKALMGDFYCHVHAVDGEVEGQFVKLLDAILGDEWASYLMCECMNNPGSITEKDGTRWPIGNADDVAAYVAHRDATPPDQPLGDEGVQGG